MEEEGGGSGCNYLLAQKIAVLQEQYIRDQSVNSIFSVGVQLWQSDEVQKHPLAKSRCLLKLIAGFTKKQNKKKQGSSLKA